MTYHTLEVQGLNIFYREAGDPTKPTMLLLHGFPTASHMFRDLIPALSDHFHLIAPDFPGFGQSSAPDHSQFIYSFQHLSEIMTAFLEKLQLIPSTCTSSTTAPRLATTSLRPIPIGFGELSVKTVTPIRTASVASGPLAKTSGITRPKLNAIVTARPLPQKPSRASI